MNRRSLIWALLLIMSCTSLRAQTEEQVLGRFDRVLSELQTINYHVNFKISMSGAVVIDRNGYCYLKRLKGEPVVGYQFRAGFDEGSDEFVFYGDSLYAINHAQRTYKSLEVNKGIFGSPGGQMIVKELIQKTDGYTSLALAVTDSSYVLHLEFPDLPDLQIKHVTRNIHLNKMTYLPFYIERSQENAGRKTVVEYVIRDMQVQLQDRENQFSDKSFLTRYENKVPEIHEDKTKSLIGYPAPDFKLSDFAGKNYQLSGKKGKVILLDFWEIYCGPCVSSINDLKLLAAKYPKDKFELWSVVNSKDTFSKMKSYSENRRMNYPILFGNKDMADHYFLYGFPLYVLIDDKGIVQHTAGSFSPDLVKVIDGYVR